MFVVNITISASQVPIRTAHMILSTKKTYRKPHSTAVAAAAHVLHISLISLITICVLGPSDA